MPLSFRIMNPPIIVLPKMTLGAGVYTNMFVLSVQGAPGAIEYTIDFASPVWLKLRLETRGGVVLGTGGGNQRSGAISVEEDGQLHLFIDLHSDSDDLRALVGETIETKVFLRPRQEGAQKQTIQLRLGIVPPPPLNGYFAIDLGTTNSTAVYFNVREPKLKEGRLFIPQEVSVGNLDCDNGDRALKNSVATDLFVKNPRDLVTKQEASIMGENALLAGDDPDENLFDSCFLRAAKTVLGTDKVWSVWHHTEEGGLDCADVRPDEVLAAVLRKIVKFSEREVKHRLPEILMTYPAQWSFVERRALEAVIDKIQPAIQDEERRLTLRMNIDEASAAGLYHVYEQIADADFWGMVQLFRVDCPSGAAEGERCYRFKTLAFDFGGGSLDLSLIRYDLAREAARVGGKGAETKVKIRLLDADSLSHGGGNYVTLKLFQLLKRRIALTVANPERVLTLDKDVGDEAPVEAKPLSALDPLAEVEKEEVEEGGTRESPEVKFARGILNAKWDQVASVLSGTTLENLVSEAMNDRSVDYPPSFSDDEIDEAIETILPTQWIRHTQGGEEYVEAKTNFRVLWREAENAKQYLVNQFNRQLKAVQFGTTEFEECHERFTEVRSYRPGQLFPKLKGAVPYEKDLQLLKKACFLTLEDVFLCTFPTVAEGIRRAKAIAEPFRGNEALPYNWVIVAGNSSRSPLVRYLFMKLTPLTDPSLIKGDIANAKVAVAKGACINSLIRGMVPGLTFETHSFSTKIPRNLDLMFVPDDFPLFRVGPLNELRCTELKLGIIGASILTIMQKNPDLGSGGAGAEVAGIINYRDAAGAYTTSAIPLSDIDPVSEDGTGEVVRVITEEFGFCPPASEMAGRKDEERLDEICEECTEKRATYGEVLNQILNGCEFQKVIAWCELEHEGGSFEEGDAHQRFYLSREMALYMVEHTSEGKMLFNWESSPDGDLRKADALLDPFSGAH